ncbi:MAG: hypothetical protein P8N50_09945 [Actinomycetota bacterium]|nr:hypothetical protein [Actinomycetota bacterium]
MSVRLDGVATAYPEHVLAVGVVEAGAVREGQDRKYLRWGMCVSSNTT